MSFVVSARKYRPSTFDTVVGQDSITHTLKNAIKSKHLAQAFLFTGPRGVGKTTCARILAKTINCTSLTETAEACDQCESCVSFNNGQSLNIYELDAASNNSVDDIRALVEQVRYAPPNGGFKIYIIDEVHMLSAGAFNAFLKTLEEPPSYAIFILATTEKHKIIPTILSRCQIFDFNRIRVEDIAKQLGSIAQKENIKAEEDALHIIAQKADGALRDALSIFDQIVSFAGNTITYKDVINNLNILDYDYYFKITDDILSGDFKNVLLTFNELLSEGFDGHNFINGFSSHFRDLLVCSDEITLQLLEVSPGIKDKYLAQSKKCNADLLLKLIELCNRADIEYRAAKNQRLHVEITLLKMCSVNAVQPVQQEIKITAPAATPASAAEKKTEYKSAESKPAVSTVDVPAPSNKPQTPVSQQPAPGTQHQAPKPLTPSINPGLKKKTEPEGSAVAVTQPQLQKPADEVFSDDDLQKAWAGFAEQVNRDGRLNLRSSLTQRKPVLKDNFVIEIEIINKVQQEEIKGINMEMLDFLRKNLKNNSVTVETRIIETKEDPDRAYTPKEKFKKMTETNPDLEIMRQQFDLDLDF